MKFSKEFLVSFLILVTSAVLLHALAREEILPLRKSFADFPRRIDEWSGKALWIESDVLEVLKVDDYMMRQYSDENGAPIGLYVGYYKSLRQGASYHSPKNCLPGSGWYFARTGTTRLDIPARDRQAVEVNQVVIHKGLDKQLVLYWYQDRGRIITNEYWGKIYLVLDAMIKNRTDGALVRVTVPFLGDDEGAVLDRGKTFVGKIFPLLPGYLPS